ncbi:MAG TPA: hypothetical protein VF088_09445, partial [Pyrinomonadaceae bacterium]
SSTANANGRRNMSGEVIVAIIGFLGTIITLIVGIYTSVKTYQQSELSKSIERSEHEALLLIQPLG